MPIRIAHLSDLHFGQRFDLDMWEAVKAEVSSFKPDLLVVSGDVVDDPHPVLLLAAKGELRQFSDDVGAELIVVPGNHDVCASGLHGSIVSPRRNWFERVFFNDTATAEGEAARLYGDAPKFSETYLAAARRPGVVAFLGRLFGKDRRVARLLPAASKQELVRRPERCSVLVAALDSNSAGDGIGLATGRVAERDLVALRNKLIDVKGSYLVRVAVVHHHLLPIAFSGGRIIGAEPFMVLHNAGTVMELMAEHHFDLILHGHKHIPQFARLDLSPKDADGYPMAVVAAGSASLRSENQERANCFNLVTVANSGQIEVESFFYGGGRGPSREGRPGTHVVYREALAMVKRRASTRARERHFVRTRERRQVFEISETGDLLIEDTFTGLESRSGSHPSRREYVVALPKDGRFVGEELKLGRHQSHGGGYGIDGEAQPRNAAERKESVYRFAVRLPDAPPSGGGWTYQVRYACANSVIMTRWECEERSPRGAEKRPDDWDEEWVGCIVPHPTDILSIITKLPPGLKDIRPVLKCRRYKTYPDYAINGQGDLDLAADANWVDDPEITRQESAGLVFEPHSGEWRLTVHSPMVGYNYRVVWQTPGGRVDKYVRGEVLQQRTMLLRAFAEEVPSALLAAAGRKVAVLAQAWAKLIGNEWKDEKRCVELFVYDSDVVALRPVLGSRSGHEWHAPDGASIPLGCGISGVAFQQGRIIPWASVETDSPFVVPLAREASGGLPMTDMKTMLAIPIFHSSQHELDRPQPWACIGVMTFGSTSDASVIHRLFEQQVDEATIEVVRGTRGLAHATVDAILALLQDPSVSSGQADA